jgi:hypothetical protein
VEWAIARFVGTAPGELEARRPAPGRRPGR